MDKERVKQILKTPHLLVSGLTILGLSVLFVMILMIYNNPAYAWFSRNFNTDSGGMGIGTGQSAAVFKYAEPSGNGWGADTTFVTNGTADLTKCLNKPGDTYTFRLTVTNTGEQDIPFTKLGLVTPKAGDEVPVTDDEDVDHYLGTQIYVKVLNVNGTPVADPPAVYLLTLSAGEPVFEDKVLYTFGSEQTLRPGNSMNFVLEFTFENLNEPQDVFQDFGVSNDGVCKRAFLIE